MKNKTTYRKTEVVENSYGMLKPFNALEPSFRVEQLLSTEPEAMGEDDRLLLDGSKMPEKKFWRRFKIIVGCSYEEWLDRLTTTKIGESEWYEDSDEDFTLGGTSYAPPKLYAHPKPVEPKQSGLSAEEFAKRIYLSITSYVERSELGGIDREWIEQSITKGLNLFASSKSEGEKRVQ